MLSGKTALITGCGRGIGRGILQTFAENGANIIANSRTEGSLEDIASELSQEYGVNIKIFYFDVSDYTQVKKAFKEIKKGISKLDILVNNAGILDSGLLGMLNPGGIQKMFAVNTFGVIYMMQFAVRLMMRKKQGSIINIASIMGDEGAEGQVVYSGTKASINGISKSAAKELANYNIRVNIISPGFIDTDLTRSLSEDKFKERVESIAMGRIGDVKDVANCALFLASDLSSYVTGQTIGVDGGMKI